MKDIDAISISLRPVFQKYGTKKAILFGSYAKGEANGKSDVDLYIDSGLRGLKFVGLMEEIRLALGGRDVDVLDVSHMDADSRVAKEIQETGTVIYSL